MNITRKILKSVSYLTQVPTQAQLLLKYTWSICDHKQLADTKLIIWHTDKGAKNLFTFSNTTRKLTIAKQITRSKLVTFQVASLLGDVGFKVYFYISRITMTKMLHSFKNTKGTKTQPETFNESKFTNMFD